MKTFSTVPLVQGWLYSLQLPIDLGGGDVIPGYLQIDRIVDGDSVESGSLESFRAQGFDLPDLPVDAAQGKYWLARDEARERAAAVIAEAWLAEPVVVVRRHPTGGWSHAVKQSRPGVRIYRGWWHCRHEAAAALVGGCAGEAAACAAA